MEKKMNKTHFAETILNVVVAIPVAVVILLPILDLV
jgi:hypothetical protein